MPHSWPPGRRPRSGPSGGYLAFVGVLFGVYANEGVQGSPPWWWVAVGAAAVTAFSAAGFTIGALYPSRFAAALAAFGGFLVMTMSSQTGFSHTSGWALILPTNSNGNYQPASGIFYPYLPDLPIARVMFLAGIAVVAISLLGLPASAGGPILRRAAAAVTIAGVALTATAIGLAATARIEPNGMVIPALHDAASDRPIPYTPVCGSAAGIPVCLNPAYRGIMADVASALGPVLGEVAGLPGAPVRAAQVAGAYSSTEGEDGQAMTISGHPLVLRMPLDAENLPGVFGGTTTQFTAANAAALRARVRRCQRRPWHACPAGGAGSHAGCRRRALCRAAEGPVRLRAAVVGASHRSVRIRRRAGASARAGLYRRPAARRAAGRGPACLAGLPPGLDPGWSPLAG